jgi:hypothetical protein
MKAWARETFDWDRVARQWHSVFQKHLSGRQLIEQARALDEL